MADTIVQNRQKNIWGQKDIGKKMLLEGGLKCLRLSCFFVLVPYVY